MTARLLYSESKAIIFLTTPIAASTLLEGCVYFLNTWMLAKLGADTLAAGALVTNLFSTLVMVLWGIFSSSSMLYSRYQGEGNDRNIANLLSTSNLMSVALGILTGTILWNADILLRWLGQPPDAVHVAIGYSHGLAFAEIPDLLTFSLFNFLQGISRATATFWLSVIYVPLNLAANYILVFGKFNLPAMGAAGVGYGTCFSYCILVVIIAAYFFITPAIRMYCTRPFAFVWKEAWELLRVGTPLGVVWALGYLFLFLVTTMFGRVGAEPLAAYQIVSQWLGAFSVVTLSLSKVLAMRIGLAIGQKNKNLILAATNATVLVNVGYVIILAILLIGLPQYLIRFDLDLADPANQAVATFAESFFKVAFVYLLFDSLRYLYSGALLGLKDTRYLLMTGLICWIVIGLPLILLMSYFLPTQPIRLFEVMAFCEALGLIILAKRYYHKISDLILGPIS